jgi:uncharacterized membrane protein (DUF4010 family)
MPISLQDFSSLAIALALGLLIGIQRGWVARTRNPGERIAGVRTYTLVGLLGGMAAILSRDFGPWIIAAFLVSLTFVVTAAYWRSQDRVQDLSITSLIGTLLTFSFGVMAGQGRWTLAASCAIVTATILDNKKEIHGLLAKLNDNELDAALKLLLISVVMLSVLPNQGLGPWQALNPYEIWWMVVLIASISFIGYFAVRIGGTSKGLMFTSLFAGLSSSTALTLHYARLCRDNPAMSALLAGGILTACGTMFPRLLLVCSVINPELGKALMPSILTMMGLTFVPALYFWLTFREPLESSLKLRQNPLELSSAMGFAVILMVIILLSHVLHDWLGSAGLFILAAVSGITDVDAVSLALSRQSGTVISLQDAAIAITIAAAVNSIVKGTMALSIGGRQMMARVLLPLTIAVSGGVLVNFLN